MKRLAEQSLYEILEVPRDAPADEVERAYERAKALYGPGSLATYTLMDPDEAALLARRIEEARAVLLDPVMRAGYDAGLAPEKGRDGRAGRPLPPVIPPVKAPPAQLGRAAQRVQAAPAAQADGAASRPAAPASSGSPPEPPAATVAIPAPAAEGHSVGEASGPQQAAEPPVIQPAAPSPPVPSRADPVRPSPSSPHPGYAIPESGPWTGEVLRRVREARGLTLQQIAERTKVTRHHLENIEADRYVKLPAAVYLRGILMSLAKELRLDGQRVARSYLEQVAAAQAQPPPPTKGR